ncbi:hypothetical protein TNCT_196671 [Trichonephila clavata]|uniref:Uncharacterized protein n=1 Tax=Trichonephila clavata TaxID=2740835 RepID=A0A8X6FJG4_TRICU|nr:hypothetical protein TNCT_196671 [Trichonephila clavata]
MWLSQSRYSRYSGKVFQIRSSPIKTFLRKLDHSLSKRINMKMTGMEYLKVQQALSLIFELFTDDGQISKAVFKTQLDVIIQANTWDNRTSEALLEAAILDAAYFTNAIKDEEMQQATGVIKTKYLKATLLHATQFDAVRSSSNVLKVIRTATVENNT